MIDSILIDVITHYSSLFILISILLGAIALGHRHMIIPALFIFIMFGYRFYHREHAQFLTAVKHGEFSSVRYYLTWYANPNYHSQGVTPLILASQEGHTEIVKLLLANGADKQETNCSGKTAIQLASMNGHTEIVELLAPYKA